MVTFHQEMNTHIRLEKINGIYSVYLPLFVISSVLFLCFGVVV